MQPTGAFPKRNRCVHIRKVNFPVTWPWTSLVFCQTASSGSSNASPQSYCFLCPFPHHLPSTNFSDNCSFSKSKASIRDLRVVINSRLLPLKKFIGFGRQLDSLIRGFCWTLDCFCRASDLKWGKRNYDELALGLVILKVNRAQKEGFNSGVLINEKSWVIW